MMMYEELVKTLRRKGEIIKGWGKGIFRVCEGEELCAAADAIEELTAEVSRLRLYADNISKLPDCNSCLKKNVCEFRPRPGEYCRINCPAWLGVTDTKEADE